jgi:hypothetical protein
MTAESLYAVAAIPEAMSVAGLGRNVELVER